MKQVFAIKKALLTLFEAFPDDPEKGWMPVRECCGGHELRTGKFESLEDLLYSIALGDERLSLGHWEISNVEDGSFVMAASVLMDRDGLIPSPERLKDWTDGHAHLFHGSYVIAVDVQRVEDVPASEIEAIIASAKRRARW